MFKWVHDNGGVATDASWPYAAKETKCYNKKMKRCGGQGSGREGGREGEALWEAAAALIAK